MINVALVGIGNCASALVQGVHYYRGNNTTEGLIIEEIFGFRASDIHFVASFDVDASKVGKPLEAAIFSGKNNTLRFFSPQSSSCIVSLAPRLDGIGEFYERQIDLAPTADDDIHKILADTSPDVLVNYLPVGSDEATKYWARLCLELGIGFVNAIPSFLVSDPQWGQRFFDAGIPCVGDDVKSQIGATIVHRTLVRTFKSRGGSLDNTYQLNFGGNMDFLNMLEDKRLESKRMSKINAVVAEIGSTDGIGIHISPTDYIEHLRDNKIAYINLNGKAFGGAPISIETRMSVWDSPNSAAVVVDAIRFVAGAKREHVGGPLPICAFYFKSPPLQLGDLEAEQQARDYAQRQSFC
jgi:myo-inositol-1-phosphate synthase